MANTPRLLQVSNAQIAVANALRSVVLTYGGEVRTDPVFFSTCFRALDALGMDVDTIDTVIRQIRKPGCNSVSFVA